MAVTEFQRNIIKLIAGNRISGGESYVAGGVALNQSNKVFAKTGSSGIDFDYSLINQLFQNLVISTPFCTGLNP